ncbi:MAG: SDR family NAD(P)-dependent oxidoreductase [Chloroflexi bacterium]|nr:SDR family NAD(P)-dependent oxidoreductase [Chloroflexota bacterium]
MSIDLTGRVALVTGAGTDPGLAIAQALAAAGASLCCVDLNPDRAESSAQAIGQAGGSAFGWQADISNKFQAAGAIEEIRDVYGRLDVLVQATAIRPQQDLLTMDEWEFRRTVEYNLVGSFFIAQLAARVMADEGGGLIALLVDPVDPQNAQGSGALAASQAGVAALAMVFAQEVAASRVAVGALPVSTTQATVQALMSLFT